MKVGARSHVHVACFLQDGMTALHLAAMKGHLIVLDVLRHKISFKETSKKVLTF